MKVGDFEIKNSTCEKLLEAPLDSRLTFDYHLSELCKKQVKKLMH